MQIVFVLNLLELFSFTAPFNVESAVSCNKLFTALKDATGIENLYICDKEASNVDKLIKSCNRKLNMNLTKQNVVKKDGTSKTSFYCRYLTYIRYLTYWNTGNTNYNPFLLLIQLLVLIQSLQMMFVKIE